MKDIPQEFRVALDERFQSAPWIWLLEVEVPSTPPLMIRLCNQSKQIDFDVDGLGFFATFMPAAFGFGAITEGSEGDLPSLPLTVTGLSREHVAILINNDFLLGQKVRMMLVNANTLDNSSARFDFNLEVRAAVVDAARITFSLSSYSLHQIQTPRRRMNRLICDHCYGDIYCGFNIPRDDPGLAVLGECSKTEDACELRGARELALGVPVLHPERIGFFKGMPFGGQ